MALMLQKLTDFHEFLFINMSDPRTFNYPLISSPWPGLGLIALYLLFCLKVGPWFMEYRPPMKLDKLLIAFDIFQITSSVALFSAALWRVTRDDVNILCLPVYPEDPFMAKVEYNLHYAYFVLKLIDLLDTVFIILRKKDRQISFLHLYHHTGVAMIVWGGTKYFPGGNGVILGLLNCFVHSIMYTYYLASLLGYEQITSWKKFVTKLQMIQFALLLLHSAQLLLHRSCDYPYRLYFGLVVPQYGVMLFLFYKFYVNAYGKKNKNAPKEINGTSKSAANHQQLLESKKTN